MQNESDNLRDNKVGFFGFDFDILHSIQSLDNYLCFKDSVENENAVNIIEEKCDLIKKQFIDSYILTKENFQKLSSKEKAILREETFNGTSGVTAEFFRYVDSRSGYFIFKIFQKELNKTTFLESQIVQEFTLM